MNTHIKYYITNVPKLDYLHFWRYGAQTLVHVLALLEAVYQRCSQQEAQVGHWRARDTSSGFQGCFSGWFALFTTWAAPPVGSETRVRIPEALTYHQICGQEFRTGAPYKNLSNTEAMLTTQAPHSLAAPIPGESVLSKPILLPKNQETAVLEDIAKT